MKRIVNVCTFCAILLCYSLFAVAQPQKFNGLDMNLGNLSRLSDAETRSISPENFTGEKGAGGMAVPSNPRVVNVNNQSGPARDLGQCWKVNPYIIIEPNSTFTLAEIEGPGAIQHIWMTPKGIWKFSILRIYYDDETTPSVECPVADFFCQGWNEYAPVTSLSVCVNPKQGFNCYWQMPFRKKCKITIENINDKDAVSIFYQIDYTLTEIPEDMGYFHAQYRHTYYCENSDFVALDGVKGQGQFVGIYLAYCVHNNLWWGEGELKFFLDGDKKFPTICTTGLEDYFGGAYDFMHEGHYTTFSSPYSGLCQVIRPDGEYQSQQRYGLYRWHIMDPIRFKKSIRLTIQDLGWHKDRRFLQQHSEIGATTFWYQSEPHAKFPEFPSWRDIEVL